MTNIVYATFQEGKGNVVYTKTRRQHDRGVVLRISGVALPEKYQVHFAHENNRGVATSIWASGSDITIPDAYFVAGEYIHIWIYFTEDGTKAKGASEYEVIIPVQKRPAILQVESETASGLVIDAELSQEDHTLIFH